MQNKTPDKPSKIGQFIDFVEGIKKKQDTGVEKSYK